MVCNRFIYSHHIDDWIKKEQGKHPKCQCGCSQEITVKRFHHWMGIPKYIPGHHNNSKNNDVNINDWIEKNQGKHLCWCGCGRNIIIKKQYHYHGIPKYIPGHYNNKEIDVWVEEWVEENQGKHFCHCGCENKINITIQHYRRGIPNYINGHQIIHKGKNHHGWKGGISFKPYCYKFNNELKEKIRNRDNRTCQLCGKIQEENGNELSVHHIHYDKENCYPDLITLCNSCNAKANRNRDYWEIYFMRNLFFRRIPITIYNLESELGIWNYGNF